MAETKTTIPVEIKMGNAGTNDANLPAFKEGSIIFTKDTKKIYIDPVGETERIAVGGTEVDLSGKQDKFADLDYVWDGDSFKYLSLNLKNATKKISSTGGSRPITGETISIVSDLRLSTETGNRVFLTVGAITVDPIDNGRYSSGLSNTFLKFKDREASATLPSMLITPTAHNGTTPAYLTFASPAQNTAVGNTNVRLTGIAAPTADNDAVNRGYLTTKYGSTYYESQDQEFYFPSGSNMVIPNTNMGRLFIGSESAVSTDFKIYVNDPIDNGKLIITNLKTPTNNEDAANKAYVDTETAKKQGKFADVTNPGICKVTMSNSGQTYFCNNSSDSGIYFDSSIRLLQGKGIKNDDDLVNKKYVDDNSGAGKKYGTSEIFNDYENNIVWNTKYDGGILVTDLTATIVTLENVEGLAVGGTFNIYSLTHDYTSDNLTITAINTSTNKVTFSPEYAGPPLTVATLYVVNSTATKTTKLFYKYAHAEGYQTKAINNYSHAEGIGTIAGVNTGTEEGQAQTAVGMYNTTNPYTLFMVGNGTAKNARNNAFEVYRDGHAEVQTQGTTDNSVVIKSALDTKQDKITNTTDLTVKSITALGVLKAQAYAPLDGQPSFQVFSGTIGQSSMFTFSDKKVVEFKKDSQAFSPSPMPVLGIATPISAADTTLGITDANLPYQAANKKYVDDIKTELLNAITHPYTYDETTKELTLIL